MASYLVVANQTAVSKELAAHVRTLATNDPAAHVAILVPATLPAQLLTWTPEAAERVAWKVARAASAVFEANGVHVVRAAVGDPDAFLAIEDELLVRPGAYDALIICTLPLGLSRWLRMDLPKRAEAAFGLRVIHLTAGATPSALSPDEGALEGLPARPDTAEMLSALTRFLVEALRGGADLPPERAREALVAIGPASVPALIGALRHPDDQVRWEAAKALGELRPSDAADPLVTALDDSSSAPPGAPGRWPACPPTSPAKRSRRCC